MVKYCRTVKNYMIVYCVRILNRRNALLIVLLFFLFRIYLAPIRNFSNNANQSALPWVLPFLLTDIYFLILFMTAVVYFFSNVPFMNRWNNFYMLRCGKGKWLKEQVLYIIISAFVITGVSCILTTISLYPQLKIGKGWGSVLYTLAQTNAGDVYGLFWKISAQYISKHSSFEAMLMTIVIMLLGVTFIGVLMFLCGLFGQGLISIAVPTAIIAYSHVTVAMGEFTQKKLSMTSPISWMRVADYDIVRSGYKIAPPFLYAVCVYVGLILILIFLCCLRLRKMDFIWNDEEE